MAKKIEASRAARPAFVYTTYIKTTPTKLWAALTRPEFTRNYWYGVTHESSWKPGTPWRMVFSDGTVGDSGEVVESEKPRKLVLRWRHELHKALRDEGYSICTYELEKAGKVVKLTITHQMEKPLQRSNFLDAVGGGWPKILASLKSYLETGEPLSISKG